MPSVLAALLLPGALTAALAAEDDSAYQEGRDRYAHKRFADAIPKLQEYLARHPSGTLAPEAEFLLGGAYFQTKKWQEAAAALSEFLQMSKDEKDQPTAQYYLGEAYYNLKDTQKAIAAYNRFLGMNKAPEDRPYAEAHLGDIEYRLAETAGNALGVADDYRAAAAAFRKVLSEPGAKNLPAVLSYASYWMGESLFQAKDYTGAVQAFNTIIQQYPASDEYGDALLAKGVALAASGNANDSKAAAAVFQEVVDKYPGADRAAEALSSLGNTLYAQNDYSGAAAAYQKLLDSPQSNNFLVDALDGLAWSNYKQNRWAEAAPLFEKVAAKTPDKKVSSEAAYLAGYSYLKAGNVGKAQTLWQPIIGDSSNPHAADATYSLGRRQFDQKEWPGAIASFRSFVTAFPRDKRAYFAYAALGDAAVQANEYGTAADAFRGALPLVPDAKSRLKLLTGLLWADEHANRTDDANAVRAQIKRDFPGSDVAATSTLQETDSAYKAGDWAKALAGYQVFLKEHGADPDAGRVTYRAGFALLHLDRVPEAAVLFDRLVERHASSALVVDALSGLSGAYLKAGSYPEAVAVYSRLLADFPKSEAAPVALYNRATAYARLKQWAPALKDYSQLVQDYPQDKNAADAAYWAAWIQQKQDNGSGAIVAYRKMLQDFPNGPHAAETYLRLGNLLSVAKRYPEALAAWDAVATRFPNDPAASAALLNRGQFQEGQKNIAEAMKAFGQIRKDYPRSAEAEASTLELARLNLEKNPVEANTLLNEFKTAYPQSKRMGEALYFDGLLRYNEKKYTEAASLFRKAAQGATDAPLSEARFWAAESLLRAGQYEEALPLYEDYLKTHPASKWMAAANFGAGLSALKRGSYDRALTALRQAQKLDDATYGARASLYEGEVLLAQHKPENARDAFLKELTHTGYAESDLEGEAEFGLGQAYEDLQRWSDARAEYGKAVNAPDAAEWAAKARARLEALKASHPG